MLDTHMHPMHYGCMKLETYLKKKKMTDAAFGALIGLSQSQVSRIRRGLSWPSKETLIAIAAVTNNSVTVSDIIKAGPNERVGEAGE
jgi:transcriptional regulator with XRE-family HTH domain